MIITSVLNGLRGAFLQPSRIGKSESGRYEHVTWEGTSAEINQVALVVDNYPGATWEIQRSWVGGKDRLDASIPFSLTETEFAQSDWEFFAVETEKDVLESDLSTIEAIPQADKIKLRDAILNPDPTQPAPTFISGNATTLYNLMLNGLRSVPLFAPALRHTQTVSYAWTVPAALTNVRKIISTASLGAQEDIPSGLLFNLPNDVSTRAGYAYGWFKKFPTVRKSARQKAQMEQEWQYGLWSTFIFGNPL